MIATNNDDAGKRVAEQMGPDLLAAARTVGRADPGEEEPEEVVDLGDGADGRAGIGRDRFLVDGDGRRDALDGLDLGLLHLVDELAGVGREALDVAALALGEEGVESQGRLPGAGRPGDHDQLVPGQGQVDVLEIVLRRPLDANLFQHNQSILTHKPGTQYHFPICQEGISRMDTEFRDRTLSLEKGSCPRNSPGGRNRKMILCP